MTRRLLLKVLIVKSILDTFLVGTIAVGSYLVAFPPYFHGWGEATSQGIAGWAVDNNAPWDRVQVQLFVDGVFMSSGIANLSRPDVAAAGWARDQWHGYSFELSNLRSGSHDARIYAVHESGDGYRRTLQLLGDPIHFTVKADGTLVDARKAGVAR